MSTITKRRCTTLCSDRQTWVELISTTRIRSTVPNRATSRLYTPTPEVNGVISLAVNGKQIKPVIEKGYAVITRDWKAGDKIEMELPLQVQRIKPSDQIASTRGKVALRYG